MNISAANLDFQQLNREIKDATGDVSILDCCGQRFIGCGLKDKNITIYGRPGNALGAYLDGSVIVVHGNAQDAVGDTMNAGKIIIHGDADKVAPAKDVQGLVDKLHAEAARL